MGLIGDDRLINRCDEDNRQTFPLFHLLAKNLLTKKKQVLTRREPSVNSPREKTRECAGTHAPYHAQRKRRFTREVEQPDDRTRESARFQRREERNAVALLSTSARVSHQPAKKKKDKKTKKSAPKKNNRPREKNKPKHQHKHMADDGGGCASRGLSSISCEIGPPIFTAAPNGKAAAGAAGGLLKTLFGVSPPNSHSTMITRGSFKDLNFVGGEEDAQDAWRDKWEAHKRASLDLEGKLVGGSNHGSGRGGGVGLGGDTGGGAGGDVSRVGVPVPTKAGDVYSVALGRGGAGAGAGAEGRGSSSLGVGVGTHFTSHAPRVNKDTRRIKPHHST